MSTVEHAQPAKLVPPLMAGERLDQPTFHARYQAMPDGTWAELVGGVVYMPSPVRLEHAGYDDVLSYWVGHYRRFTKGVQSGKNATMILGESSECQPDGHLRIPRELGGQSWVESGFVAGPVELVIEISRSSRYYDLNEKKDGYEQAGVLEYVVFELDPDRVHWFSRRGDRFVNLLPGADGIYRSEVFPGLWLDPAAFYAEDLDGLVAVLEQGVATPEHAAFAARLAAARG